jgi:hypothetical protein
MALTVPQAARLWNADETTCSAAFRALVRVGFLAQRQDGRFVRHDQWSQVSSPWRMAA